MTRTAVAEETSVELRWTEQTRAGDNPLTRQTRVRAFPCVTDEDQAKIAALIETGEWDFEGSVIPDWHDYKPLLLEVTSRNALYIKGRVRGFRDTFILRTDSRRARADALGWMGKCEPVGWVPDWWAQEAAERKRNAPVEYLQHDWHDEAIQAELQRARRLTPRETEVERAQSRARHEAQFAEANAKLSQAWPSLRLPMIYKPPS